MGKLRSADTLIGPAVAETLRNLELSEEDAAAAVLAQRYADAIDNAEDQAEMLKELGPRLLACLESLGATPKARATMKKGTGGGGQGKLAQLRAARA